MNRQQITTNSNAVITICMIHLEKSRKKLTQKHLINLLIKQDREIKSLKLENLKLQIKTTAQIEQTTTNNTKEVYGNSNNPLRRN